MKSYLAAILISSASIQAADVRCKNLTRDEIINGTAQMPSSNYAKAKKALDEQDYASARKYFSLVIAAGPGPNNPHYQEAGDYIGPEKDTLYRKMIESHSKNIGFETAAIITLKDEAKSLPKGSDERKRLEDEVNKLIAKLNEQRKEAARESAMRGRTRK